MNASLLPTIGECSSCLNGPRPLDPETGACDVCLKRHGLLTGFFRLVCEDPVFKPYARESLSPRKTEIFDAMFGRGHEVILEENGEESSR
jgi:hypothetical protein